MDEPALRGVQDEARIGLDDVLHHEQGSEPGPVTAKARGQLMSRAFLASLLQLEARSKTAMTSKEFSASRR